MSVQMSAFGIGLIISFMIIYNKKYFVGSKGDQCAQPDSNKENHTAQQSEKTRLSDNSQSMPRPNKHVRLVS